MHLLPSLTLLATAFTALSSAAALPQSESDLVESRTYGGNDKCLCEEDANTLRDAYVRMISAWNPVDAKYLTDDFKDTSASINILIGKPLDGSVPTFANKQEFVAHMTVAPDNLPLRVTFSTFNCNYITVIWTATFGVAQKAVRGIAVAGAVYDKKKKMWLIKSVDVEWNSMAYLLDIGGSYTLPAGLPPA
ncbi:unnamed protein product [Sordaria macrospora k-hell]|uniref:WGS project CABT00000000 data, contig 2.24 n=2 Tax=Sordaria macrospora TaxID=5147 RepID=F7W3B5_SORMK|nr:uncharacterized protein SMAC_05855 [Sordaria macrospora k-hell]KAH7627865.1 hypothetical protein B0T09DRAFT_385292 [Sordaria sp. MPI-SDFR-AT-0083]CCC12117.1 unnamed protein product [Sordaria macrospora k-hell]